MLNTAYDAGQRPPEREPERWRGHADASLYFGCSDVDAAYEELRAKRAAVEPPRAVHGMKQLFVRDPDNYQLCFTTASEPR
jgi:hypothetical protein